jgi:hypothetical protein
MHSHELNSFLGLELPESLREFTNASKGIRPLVTSNHIQRHALLTKAFVIYTLRSYFYGHGIASYFYPLIRYTGASSRSKMLHFAILCSFGSMDTAQPQQQQTYEQFLKSKSFEVDGNKIVPKPLAQIETDDVGSTNPTF